jgi:hypothetical protein
MVDGSLDDMEELEYVDLESYLMGGILNLFGELSEYRDEIPREAKEIIQTIDNRVQTLQRAIEQDASITTNKEAVEAVKSFERGPTDIDFDEVELGAYLRRGENQD